MKKIGLFSLCVAVSLALTACCGADETATTNASGTGGTGETAAHGHGGMTGGTAATGAAASGHSHSAENTNVQANWEFAQKPVVAKQDNKLQISVQDKSGSPINEFDEEHTKLMHLIVVSKDLSYFNHIHPEYVGKGQFDITTQLPAGGDYEFIADFVPKGTAKANLKHWTHVDGAEAKPVPLVVDKNMTKTVDGKEITLSFEGELKAENPVKIKYNIKDAATKKPISDLEQYLGAVGHTVVLDESAGTYVHVHPSDEAATGPDALFETTFPKSGKFKIWGQFQHKGQVFTVSYVVDVK